MVDLALLQTVSYIAGALGVCVAAIYYVLNLRVQQTNMKNTLDTRQAQLFMQVYQEQSTSEFLRLWDDAMNRSEDDIERLWSTKSVYNDAPYIAVTKYFEGIAVLLKKHLLDIDLVYEVMPTMIMSFWLKYEPHIESARERLNMPQAARNLEYLGELMVAEAKRRGDPTGIRYSTTPP